MNNNNNNDNNVLLMMILQSYLVTNNNNANHICELCDTGGRKQTLKHMRFVHFGKGQMGSALMGSLQISCFLTEGLFGYSC